MPVGFAGPCRCLLAAALSGRGEGCSAESHIPGKCVPHATTRAGIALREKEKATDMLLILKDGENNRDRDAATTRLCILRMHV